MFSLLLFMLFLTSRFGYKILVLWYFYMLNLITFAIIVSLVYFFVISVCVHISDFYFFIFDEE